MVTKLIMPPAGLPNKGLRRKKSMSNRLFTKENFLRGVHPARCRRQLTESGYCCSEIEYLVFVSLFTFLGWQSPNILDPMK